ncbi:MAG: PAS domain-containing protein, partial [Succinivibrionaceae bacterium]|nr:PAS domain-containing protein [Succinivibrionaceae bacterium]
MSSKGDLASAILDSASTAIILVNRDLRIKYLNPAAEQMLGVSMLHAARAQLGRIIGKSSIVLKRVQDDIVAGRSFNQSEVLIVSKSGEHTVDVMVNRFEREGEEPLALVEMYEVNGRRRISNEIHQHSQQKAARFLIRELAHEIKNPLSGLRGAAQLLERELNEDQKEYTKIIIEQSDRLKNLVNRLLGPQHAEKKQFISIHEILEKVIKLTGFSLPENIRIKRDYDPSLPEVYVAPEQI